MITDFGLSRILERRHGRCLTLCGTPLFLAPEILARNALIESPKETISLIRAGTLIRDAALGYGVNSDLWR